METGTVKWFSRDNGYGFITPESGSDLFVHRSSIEGMDEGQRNLEEGRRVGFEISPGQKNPQASHVRLAK